MENQGKTYLEAKQRLERLETEIQEVKNTIDDTFVFWYMSEYPEEFKKLQDWATQKIRKIVSLRYMHGDSGEWADAVIIKTGNGQDEDEWDVETIVFNTSDYFDRQAYEDEFIYADECGKESGLKNIHDIARHIYRNYPTNESEEL
ncbi:MAG: hypothetical protein ACYCSB_01315 [bacterium]|jgi:hypothetical protein